MQRGVEIIFKSGFKVSKDIFLRFELWGKFDLRIAHKKKTLLGILMCSPSN